MRSLVGGVTTSCQCRCITAGPHGRPAERRKVVKAGPALHMKAREQKAAAAGAAHVRVHLCESKVNFGGAVEET